MSDDLRPNLTPQSVASLLVRENIVLVAPLENEFANGDVSPPSHSATSTGEVKLGPEHLSSGTSTSWRHAIDQLESL